MTFGWALYQPMIRKRRFVTAESLSSTEMIQAIGQCETLSGNVSLKYRIMFRSVSPAITSTGRSSTFWPASNMRFH